MLGSNPDCLVLFGSPGEFVCKANDFLWPLLLVEGGGGEDVRFKSRLLSFIWLPGRDLNPLPSLKFSLLKGKLLAVSPQRSHFHFAQMLAALLRHKVSANVAGETLLSPVPSCRVGCSKTFRKNYALSVGFTPRETHSLMGVFSFARQNAKRG